MDLDRLLVRVINHRSSPDRRAHMADVMARFPALSWDWFDALDGDAAAEFAVDQKGAQRVICRTLLPGEIGNIRSHRRLWQQLLESDKDYLLAIEDDVEIDADFLDCLARCIAFGPPAHYIKLCSFFEKPFRPLAPVSERRSFVRYFEEPLGVQCYLLSRRGAERFIACLKRMIRPSDHFTDRAWEHGLPCYGIAPAPVRESPAIRSIVDRGAGRVQGARTFAYKLCKKRDNVLRKMSNIMFRLREGADWHHIHALGSGGLEPHSNSYRDVR